MEVSREQIQFFVILLVEFSKCIFGHRIIALTNTLSISHFKPMEPLLLELANRGHQLTVVSNFPRKKSLPNYTDIDMKFCNAQFLKTMSISNMQIRWLPRIVFSLNTLRHSLISSECFFQTPSFQQLITSNETFDLVITEYYHNKAFTSLGRLFNAPVIHMSSCLLPPWVSYEYGNPTNPSYIQHQLGTETDKMNFFERVRNTLEVWCMLLADYFWFRQISQQFVERYLGINYTLSDVMKYSSLVLVNTHFTLNGIRPLVPNVVEIGGIHLVEGPKKLPQV